MINFPISIDRALVVLFIGLIVVAFVGQDYSFQVASVYGLIGLFVILGYFVLTKAPRFAPLLIIGFIALWYMINADYATGFITTILVIIGIGGLVIWFMR